MVNACSDVGLSTERTCIPCFRKKFALRFWPIRRLLSAPSNPWNKWPNRSTPPKCPTRTSEWSRTNWASGRSEVWNTCGSRTRPESGLRSWWSARITCCSASTPCTEWSSRRRMHRSIFWGRTENRNTISWLLLRRRWAKAQMNPFLLRRFFSLCVSQTFHFSAPGKEQIGREDDRRHLQQQLAQLQHQRRAASGSVSCTHYLTLRIKTLSTRHFSWIYTNYWKSLFSLLHDDPVILGLHRDSDLFLNARRRVRWMERDVELVEQIGKEQEELHLGEAFSETLPLSDWEWNELKESCYHLITLSLLTSSTFFKLPSASRNLSGRNSSGSGKISGSYMTVLICGVITVPFGIWYPPTSTSAVVIRERFIGSKLARRWVSWKR